MTQRLNQRQISQLNDLALRGRLWSKVDPKIADPDLRLFINNNLVEWNNDGSGYTLTRRGRIVLENAIRSDK